MPARKAGRVASAAAAQSWSGFVVQEAPRANLQCDGADRNYAAELRDELEKAFIASGAAPKKWCFYNSDSLPHKCTPNRNTMDGCIIGIDTELWGAARRGPAVLLSELRQGQIRIQAGPSALQGCC